MNILGIAIEPIDRKGALSSVTNFLANPHFHRIVTVNPEFLIEAEKNKRFRRSLETASMRVIDGIGIVLFGYLQGIRLERYPGADLMTDILRLAEKNKWSVFFAVNKRGLSSCEEILRATRNIFPQLLAGGADFDFEEAAIRGADRVGEYDIIFCNAGAPAQEFFLERIGKNPGNLRLGMGVGGAFDFLTGKQRRAPKWIRVLGFEWLFRLILQPKRWKRIWNAVSIFLFRAIFATIKK